MADHIFRQIRTAFRHLNPNEVREMADRPISVGLVAASTESLAAMEDFLAPQSISRQRRHELVEILHRAGDPGAPSRFDLEIVDENLLPSRGAFSFSKDEPGRAVNEILDRREELHLALARHFQPFRAPVIDQTIQRISQQNALFALLTAVPDALTSFFALGWAAGEFASDTTVLTVNQVRMAFLIAAASDREVGYLEQKGQIGGIVAGAFGWRALARELAGRIPFGGGMIPKAAVAYAGSYVIGRSLERYYGIGYGYTRAERQATYQAAYERGKSVARSLLDSVRRNQPDSSAGSRREGASA